LALRRGIRYPDVPLAIAGRHGAETTGLFNNPVVLPTLTSLGIDKGLEIDAAEARLRSERRLGELMADMPKAKPPGRNGPKEIGLSNNPIKPPTLKSFGIGKNLAHVARAAAKLDEDDFESILGLYRDQQQAVTANAIYKRQKTTSDRAKKDEPPSG